MTGGPSADATEARGAGGDALLGLLASFIRELRTNGIPVSMSEHLDATEALRHVPLGDRDAVRSVLGASLVKSQSHWRAFETAFEVFFALRADRGREGSGNEEGAGDRTEDEAGAGRGGVSGVGRGGRGGGGSGELSVEELSQLLMAALMQRDQAMMAAVARQAVARYAGMEPGRPVGGTYYLYRTLRNLDLDTALDQLVALRGAGGTGRPGESGADAEAADEELTPLERRLLRDEYRARVDELKKMIEDEIRRRLVEDRGSDALAKSVRKPLPEDIDVMHATRDELEELRRALRPLSRKLAVRLARKRRHGRKGPLDFRSTVRHSLSTGGVPIEPRFRYPRPAKPEIMVVADISGSVASFARFTLHLVHAISTQFSKVRSFVFIDGIDEVTRFFDGADDPADAVYRINTEADVVWVDGHSDYGHALSVFHERWVDEITPRTSILLLGDARNNYHASQSWVLQDLANKARHIYWLNPEPRAYWNSGDSIIGEYAVHCESVIECRTLRQLEQFVGSLD